MHRTVPATENYPAVNILSAQVEKFCRRVRRSLLNCINVSNSATSLGGKFVSCKGLAATLKKKKKKPGGAALVRWVKNPTAGDQIAAEVQI